jgi:hypothetical protein
VVASRLLSTPASFRWTPFSQGSDARSVSADLVPNAKQIPHVKPQIKRARLSLIAPGLSELPPLFRPAFIPVHRTAVFVPLPREVKNKKQPVTADQGLKNVSY